MTVANANYRNQYEGNDVATSFAYTFPITADADLLVTFTDTDGTDSTLVLDTDYSVSGAGDAGGGSITYPISGDELADDEYITITRSVTKTQTTDLNNQSGFYPSTVEAMSDKLTMIVQQMQEELDRCPKLAVGTTKDAETLTGTVAEQVTACQVAQAAAEAANLASSKEFGSAVYNIKTADYTLVAADATKVNVMNTSNAQAFTMPIIVASTIFMIKNIGAGVCTITPAGSETTEVTTLKKDESVILAGDAANTKWRALSKPARLTQAETNIKTDDYTLDADDRGLLNIMNHASAKAFTLPAVVEGYVYPLKNIGAGVCTITPDGSDTTEIATLYKDESVILIGDSANTKWRVLGDTPTRYSAPLGRDVSTSVTRASATQITFAATSLDIGTSSITSVSETIDITASGAGGLDTGSEANSTWYYVWIICSPDYATVAGMLSTSVSAPTMPTGYFYKKMVGIAYNAAGGDLSSSIDQIDKFITDASVLLTNGVATSVTEITFTSLVPTTIPFILSLACDLSVSSDKFTIGSSTNTISLTYDIAELEDLTNVKIYVMFPVGGHLCYVRSVGTGNLDVSCKMVQLLI